MSALSPSSSSGNSAGRWQAPSVEQLQSALPQYEILEMLGRGGMGAVYKARQKSLNRLVAIKILPLGAAEDELKFMERFRNEAETMARMNHPDIVAVHEFGETPDGLLYFVMEFVDGTDVHRLMQDGGRISPDRALTITAHVCDALHYAHSLGVIHRDIKPANILINREGRVKVADFGLAKMNDPSLSSGLTSSRVAMGTPDYVAPEALTPGAVTDHRADVYAVGVMLYHMLTGRVPRGMFKLPSERDAGVDARFDAIVCKAMEDEREDRYQSVVDLRCDLDAIRTTPPAEEAGTGPGRTSAVLASQLARDDSQSSRRVTPLAPSSRRGTWIAAAALVGVLGAAALFMTGEGGGSGPGTTPAPSTSASAIDPAFLAQVTAAPAEQQVELVRKKLVEINETPVQVESTVREGKVTHLKVFAAQYLWPVAALKDLVVLQVYASEVEDISWLRGMKLSLLALEHGKFRDVAVLKDVPVTHLDLDYGVPCDYSSLAGKPLESLSLAKCSVTDLSFVKGMPLDRLIIDGTGVTDLSPIRGLPLQEIKLDFVKARDAELLRSITTLAKINDTPATEFLASAGVEKWTDWLGPKLAAGNFDGNGWVLEAEGVSTQLPLRGSELLPAGTQNGAIRVTFLLRDSEGVMINIRETKGAAGREQYVAQYTGKNLYIGHIPADKRTKRLVNEAVPEEIRTMPEHTLEFRFIGGELTATLNGTFRVSARHNALTVGMCDLVLTKGALVKKVETQTITVSEPPWTDWLKPKFGTGELRASGWIEEPGGFSTDRDITGTQILPPNTRDCMVRLVYDLRDSNGLGITVRDRGGDRGGAAAREHYVVDATVDSIYLGRMIPGGGVPQFENKKYPPEMRGPGERTLEFRCVGSELTATLDGTLTVTAQDSALPEGFVSIFLKKGVLLKKVEVRSLDAKP